MEKTNVSMGEEIHRGSTVSLNSKDNFKDYYKLGKKLGEGGFAEVRLCTHINSKETRAVKQFRRAKMSERDIKEDIVRTEFITVKVLKHENIVNVHDYYEDSHTY
jgi:serine/threonine protein kinase